MGAEENRDDVRATPLINVMPVGKFMFAPHKLEPL